MEFAKKLPKCERKWFEIWMKVQLGHEVTNLSLFHDDHVDAMDMDCVLLLSGCDNKQSYMKVENGDGNEFKDVGIEKMDD